MAKNDDARCGRTGPVQMEKYQNMNANDKERRRGGGMICGEGQ